jgi:excisionase family DNA binding protein
MDSHLRPLLTVEEVALRLTLPRRAVYVLVEQGQISCYRIGRRIRFAPEHVSAFLDSHRQENRADASQGAY